MRVVLTGANGQLGAYLVERLASAGHEVLAWSGSETGTRAGVTLRPLDITHTLMTERLLTVSSPDAIVHAAAISTADAVRHDPVRARAVNIEATERLAEWSARHDRRMVYLSTDLVFDGSRSWYRESDHTHPILAYGRTKLEAERSVLAIPRGLVARMSLLYGPAREGRATAFDQALATLRAGEPRTFFEDEYRTPLHYATAAAILTELAGSDATGLLHVAGRERVSRFDLMRRAAVALGIDPNLIRANRQADAGLAEPRPADVSLNTDRLAGLFPDLARPTIEEIVASPN